MKGKHWLTSFKLFGLLWLGLVVLPYIFLNKYFFQPKSGETRYYLAGPELYIANKIDSYGFYSISLSYKSDFSDATVLKLRLPNDRLSDYIMIDSLGAIELWTPYLIKIDQGAVPVNKVEAQYASPGNMDASKIIIEGQVYRLSLVNGNGRCLLKEMQ